jgi:hypothetical protein
MSRRSLVLIAALLGTVLALPAQAQWKWRDKAGQIMYSDLAPPPGTLEADILQRPNPTQVRPAVVAASGAASGPRMVTKSGEPELEAKRKKAEQEKAETAKAENERRAVAQADNCSRAKAYLRTLEDGVRIVRNDAKGERSFMDDQTRAAETRHARDVIATECK